MKTVDSAKRMVRNGLFTILLAVVVSLAFAFTSSSGPSPLSIAISGAVMAFGVWLVVAGIIRARRARSNR